MNRLYFLTVERLIFFLVALSLQVQVSAQSNPFAIANIGGLHLNIETDTCFSGVAITSLSPNQKLVSSATLSSNCGIWQKVSIPSPTQFVNTSGFICGGLSALCDIVPDTITPYVEVQNTDTSGLFVRPVPDTGHVTINGLNAKIWDGQLFAVTGNTQMLGGILWREIYLTDNCSQLTGWVQNDFLLYYTGLIENEYTDLLYLNLFPNPATDRLQINFKNQSGNNYAIIIFDAFGRIVGQYKNQNHIVITQLESAIYFLRLEQDGLSGINSFVKL